MLNFIPFYAASSITIPYLQFILPIKVSYLMLIVPLNSVHFTFINAFIVCPEP